MLTDVATQTICFPRTEFLNHGIDIVTREFKPGYASHKAKTNKVLTWNKSTQHNIQDIVTVKEEVDSKKMISNVAKLENQFLSISLTGEAIGIQEKKKIKYYSVFTISKMTKLKYGGTDGLKYYCTDKGEVKIVKGYRPITYINGSSQCEENRIKLDSLYVYNTTRGYVLCRCDQFNNGISKDIYEERTCPACLAYYCYHCLADEIKECKLCGLSVVDSGMSILENVVKPADREIKQRPGKKGKKEMWEHMYLDDEVM